MSREQRAEAPQKIIFFLVVYTEREENLHFTYTGSLLIHENIFAFPVITVG